MKRTQAVMHLIFLDKVLEDDDGSEEEPRYRFLQIHWMLHVALLTVCKVDFQIRLGCVTK